MGNISRFILDGVGNALRFIVLKSRSNARVSIDGKTFVVGQRVVDPMDLVYSGVIDHFELEPAARAPVWVRWADSPDLEGFTAAKLVWRSAYWETC